MKYQFDPSNHVHSHEELLEIRQQRWRAHRGGMHGHHGMNKLSYVPVLFGGLVSAAQLFGHILMVTYSAAYVIGCSARISLRMSICLF